nr:hypothetical protein JVH1_0207 [Rhodococcus sp. JVH1]
METAEPHGTWGGFTEEERKEWRLQKRFRRQLARWPTHQRPVASMTMVYEPDQNVTGVS